jgi:hypothetical protein
METVVLVILALLLAMMFVVFVVVFAYFWRGIALAFALLGAWRSARAAQHYASKFFDQIERIRRDFR